MMRSRVILALSLSVILIGGAFFARVQGKNVELGSLSVVNNPSTANSLDSIANNYLETSSSTEGTSQQEDLTGTDLVGRQLISDYLSLANSGQDTDTNLSTLTNKYIESIPTLVTAEQVTYADLVYGNSDKVSLATYDNKIELIYNQYTSKLVALQSTPGLKNIDMSSEFSASMNKMGDLYQETAKELKKVTVPSIVAEQHLKLVNAYLKNSVAAYSISTMGDDPATAFAGLVMLNDSTDQETLLWVEIQDILSKSKV